MFPFYMILTEFCENSKVISCDFSIMKNTVASYSSSLPIKLICCFKSRFSNSICLLKSMQLVYKASKSIYNLINYQMCNLCFYSFQYFFRMFLLCFLLAYQNNFFNQLIPWHLLFQFFVYNTSKKKIYHLHFQMMRQIIYWIYYILVLVCLFISHLYWFYLLVLLNPVFNCSKSLLKSPVDKVTSGTHSFVSFLLNVAFVKASIPFLTCTGGSALGLAFRSVFSPFSSFSFDFIPVILVLYSKDLSDLHYNHHQKH